MNRQKFEEENRDRWMELERLLDQFEQGRTPIDAEKLPGLFRQVCGDLSIAQYRMYGMRLCDRLNDVVIRGYKHVYRGVNSGAENFIKFVWIHFPQAVRSEWRLFWLCMFLFWAPFFAFIASAYFNPQWLQAVLDPEMMAHVEGMYGEGEESQIEYVRRKFGSNFMMFCFYIFNNVGINFRIFAGGILAGLGTVFFLLFNGVFIGAIVGYVHYACDTEKLYTFVAGHSSFELLGMVVAGMSGMRLGLAILHPGRLSRKDALVASGRRSIRLLYGAAGMTFIAAGIEGFWSPLSLPPTVKYTVGIALWILLAAYFLFSGKTAATYDNP